MPLQARGEFALVKEELESALELSGQPVKRGTMAHKHIVYMMLAEAAAQLRDAATLQRYSPLLEELAIRDDHRPYQAIAHRCFGIICILNEDYAQAGARLAQALALFEELEAPWQVGRTLVEIAELALAQSDEAGARDSLTRALVEFEAIGAMPDVERTRAVLEALGQPISTPSASESD